MRSKMRTGQLSVVAIVLGAAVYAFGLHYFVIPNRLMEGGITGVALLLNYSLGWRPSVTTIAINVPLFLIGWRFIGKSQMLYTILGTASLSVFLWLMEHTIELGWIEPFYSKSDYLLAALYAGVTIGARLGIVFRSGGTTGGTDIIARILQKKAGLRMGQVILVFDAIVLTASLLYISKEKVLYTLVMVFIAAKIIDFIQEGAYAAKAFTIISDKADEIAARITSELDRGATIISAAGGYSGEVRQVVYCVVHRQETVKLKALVRRIDPRAFLVINDVHEVLGEGFHRV